MDRRLSGVVASVVVSQRMPTSLAHQATLLSQAARGEEWRGRLVAASAVGGRAETVARAEREGLLV